MAIERAFQFSGARTGTGSESSISTMASPEAATKATRPRAMRAPTPLHQGQLMVPIRSISSTGTSARPSRPIRTRTNPSPTSA